MCVCVCVCVCVDEIKDVITLSLHFTLVASYETVDKI